MLEREMNDDGKKKTYLVYSLFESEGHAPKDLPIAGIWRFRVFEFEPKTTYSRVSTVPPSSPFCPPN
jgi:hypothetical protein